MKTLNDIKTDFLVTLAKQGVQAIQNKQERATQTGAGYTNRGVQRKPGGGGTAQTGAYNLKQGNANRGVQCKQGRTTHIGAYNTNKSMRTRACNTM